MSSDTALASTARTEAPRENSDDPIKQLDLLDKPQPARRGWLRPALFTALPLTLIAGGYVYVTGGKVMSVDDAYIEADKVGVSTDVSGVVKEVDVAENQHVAPGQVLYRLDDLPFQLALARAEAQVGTVRNDVNVLKANYKDMQAQIKQARYDVGYYSTQLHRQQDLLNAHVASQTTFDTAQRGLQNAQQKLASVNDQLTAIAASLSGDPNIPVERQPRYLDALAQRDEAARQLAHTVVKAPFAGIATNVPSIAPGKYLPASTTAFNLVEADHAWVDANPKETELTYVRAGQRATIKVDTYPDARWRGVVESISPAAAQEFSLLPAQNSSGNWVKVVQRIPMRVRVDTSDKSLPTLRPGMSVEVEIETGHRRGPPHFLTALFGHTGRRG
ncbi:HlyD family secretion protein [Caulobacter sp. S45]|uniref:HlyD family secretion protein n=1 Tax=Caulobacter sp. S45 TaxID=1641861 RepID=UPI001C2084F9|nr:HlyD family secretion protein [Caulobacter sp. S45]